MTGQELKTFTESVLDGVSIDETLFYQLLNIAKTKLEEMRVWQYLKKLDSSNSASAGTNSIGFTLPTDFALDYKVLLGTDNNNEYLPVNFEDQHLYTNVSRRYYIDLSQDKFFLTGNVSKADTIYFYYKRFTPELTSATSPVFPTRFQPLLGFYVAAFYQAGIDSDDIFARMAPENRLAALELQRAMESWDAGLAFRSQDNRLGVTDSQPVFDIGQL